MVYIEDTRQQAGKHDNIRAHMEKAGDTILRSKLLVGDYQKANDGSIVVDTKSGVLELMMDCFRDHARFRRELLTAQESGIELYILIEEEIPGGRLSDWVSPRFSKYGTKRGAKITYASPAALRKSMITMESKYGVRFVFCPPSETGRYIKEILDRRPVPSGWRLTE